MNYHIVMDIGATELKFARMNQKLILCDRGRLESEAIQGGAHLLERVCTVIKTLLNCAPNEQCLGIALSTSGIVDCDAGSILYAYEKHIPDYTGMQVKQLIEKRFGLPCELENDVNAAGLGEYYQGAGDGTGDCYMITYGTGIGGCYIHQGEIIRGAGCCAGELGYIPMLGGLYQDFASASALCRDAAVRKGRDTMNGIEVFDLAEAGDPDCLDAVDQLIDSLTTGLTSVCYAVNPDLIILGGGIMAREEFLKNRILDSLKGKLLPIVFNSTRIDFARTGNDAGMIGAYYHFQFMQAKRAKK